MPVQEADFCYGLLTDLLRSGKVRVCILNSFTKMAFRLDRAENLQRIQQMVRSDNQMGGQQNFYGQRKQR